MNSKYSRLPFFFPIGSWIIWIEGTFWTLWMVILRKFSKISFQNIKNYIKICQNNKFLIITQKVCAGGLYFGLGSGFPLSNGRKNCSGCRRCSITQEIPSQRVSKQFPSVWWDSINNFIRCNHPLNLWHPFSMSDFCFAGPPFKISKGSGSKVRKRGWSIRFLSKHLWVFDWRWM